VLTDDELTALSQIEGPLKNQDGRTLCEAGAATHCQTSITAREIWKLFERAAPKAKIRQTDGRVLCAREIITRFFAAAKLLKRMVARDGIEPPTPAFSGPLTDSPKWFEINECH